MMYRFNCAQANAQETVATGDRMHGNAEALDEAIAIMRETYKLIGLTIRTAVCFNDFGRAFSAVVISDSDGLCVFQEVRQVPEASEESLAAWRGQCSFKYAKLQAQEANGAYTEVAYERA